MSKKIKTMDEIRRDVMEKDLLTSDCYAKSTDLEMDMNGKLKGLSKNFKVLDHEFDDWSMSQVFQKNGMPAHYFKKLMAREEYQLVREHLNYQMTRREDDYLIRMKKEDDTEKIRAVLSEEYSPFDNKDILNIVEAPLKKLDYNIENYRNEDGIFMTRLVMKDMSENISEKRVDDILKVGILIMNSEIGKSGIRIFPLVYRVVCSNGLVMWENMGQKERFYKKHRWIDREGIQKWAEVAINQAVYEAEKGIEKMKESKKIEIESPQEYILKRIPRLTNNVKEKIVETWQNEWSETEYKNSMYAVINSMTSVARDFEPELRLEVEKEAGKLIAA